MNDTMLYVMVGLLIGVFGWATFEYAKAGYEAWREQHHSPVAEQPNSEETKTG